jgi:hypothetical protein
MARHKKSPVVRITVDERLSDDLVRLLIAPLAGGVDTFADRDEDWGPEQEMLVNATNYALQMGVREDKLPWHTLAEGQVFLVGQFKTVGPQTAPEGFQVRPGGRAWLRIDNLSLVKEPAKQLYSALIQRKEGQDG